MNLFTQSFTEPFPILQLTLKATLLLALFFSLWMLFRGKSAAFRHSILVMALVSVPCLSLAQLLIPSQQLPWLEQNVVANFQDAFDFSSVDAPRNSELFAADSNAKPADTPPNEAIATEPAKIVMESHSETPDGLDLTISPNQPSGVYFWSVKRLLIVTWLTVASVLLARFAAAWLIVGNIVRQSPKFDSGDLIPSVQNLIEEFTSSRCEFRQHKDKGQMPMCFGLLRYAILLPQEFGAWSAEDQRSVILHEFAHARRRDCLVNFLAHIECAVLWFHPLSWTLLRCLKSESEMACDDWAIARGIDNANYASALFDVTMSTRRKPTVAVVSVSMSDCSPLERRMQSILSPSVPRKATSLLGHLAIAVISITAISFLSAFHLGASVVTLDSLQSGMKTEHRIVMENGAEVRGELTGSIKLETSYGNANLDLAKLRSVKRIEGGKHQILTDDDSTLTGIIRQNKLAMRQDGLDRQIKVSDFSHITTIGNANLVPEKITNGFLKDGISYSIRAPKDYQPAAEYPAIVFLHDANSNSATMVQDFVKMLPDVADRFLLIGINGENKSKKVEGGFNYTYIDFAGRSKYGGFPGTDRQSPALVTESITDLKDRIPISKVLLMGQGDGAFLTFSIAMNYPEMITGTITTNGGLLVQTAPKAYEDKDLIEAQKKVRKSIMYFDDDGGDHEKSHTWTAAKAFRKAGHRERFYRVLDKRAVPQILAREIRLHMKNH